MTAKIPATVITGFLGAGKTTLMRHLMASAPGRRMALVVNEFGDIGVDGDLLAECGAPNCTGDDIFELPNGCICCTVADDFLPTISRILDRPEPPDHILIETSGLALPKPLVQAFNWPEIRTRVTVDGVIAVIDCPAAADGRFAADPAAVEAQRRADDTLDHDSPLEELFEDQIACADLVLLNKADLLDGARLGRVERMVADRLRPGVRAVPTVEARLDAAVALGLHTAAEDDIDGRPSLHDGAEEHGHDEFESFVVTLGAVAEAAALARRIDAAMAGHDILRVKGFAHVAGRNMRLVVQGVGRRIQHYFDREWRDGEERATRLVVIGMSGLDRAAIRAALAG